MKSKLLTVALCILTAVCLWAAAFEAGINHAICDALCYIVDYDDPDAPEGDTILYIELDDNLYTHGLYIG